MAMAIEDVAAGDGALRTCSRRPAHHVRCSHTQNYNHWQLMIKYVQMNEVRSTGTLTLGAASAGIKHKVVDHLAILVNGLCADTCIVVESGSDENSDARI